MTTRNDEDEAGSLYLQSQAELSPAMVAFDMDGFKGRSILGVKSRRENCGTIGGKADASKKFIDRRSDLY